MVNALYTILTNKNRPSRSEFLSCGGAAGYCPRVQKVTDYSSTGIVRFTIFTASHSKKRTIINDSAA